MNRFGKDRRPLTADRRFFDDGPQTADDCKINDSGLRTPDSGLLSLPFSLSPFLPFLLSILFLTPTLAWGQVDRERTEKQIQALEAQIEAERQRLASARERERTELERLEELDRHIGRSRELVTLYQRQVQTLQLEQDSMQVALTRLEMELSDLKTRYQTRALHGYKYGRLHTLALVLSASSINEMLVRIQYLRRFTLDRKRRLSSIVSKGTELAQRREQLQENIAKSRQLLTDAQANRERLDELQSERAAIVSDLKQNRASIEEQLQQKEREQSRLQQQLRDIIATEMRAREAASAGASAEAIRLSGSFKQNRGNLPWPVNGVVTKSHGIVRNPITNTETPNPGVEIAASSNSPVRSVFAGQVVRIGALPGFGTFIVVQHGSEFSTVYANLSGVRVSEGQTVEAGATLGLSGGPNEPLGAALFFAVYEKDRDVNPVPWLRKQ